MLRFLPKSLCHSRIVINDDSLQSDILNPEIWLFITKLDLQPDTQFTRSSEFSFTETFVCTTQHFLYSHKEFVFRGYVDPTKAEDMPLVETIIQSCNPHVPVYLAGCYLIKGELLILTRNLGNSFRHFGVRHFPVAEAAPMAKGSFGKIVKIQGVIKPKFGFFGERSYVDKPNKNIFKAQAKVMTSKYNIWALENEILSANKAGNLRVRDDCLYGEAPNFTRMSDRCEHYSLSDKYAPFYSLFTMRLLPGLNLDEMSKRAKAKPEEHKYFNSFDGALTTAIEFMRSLTHLHAQGVTHCDVSPGNVMIACDEKLKFITASMIDTGLSRNDELLPISAVRTDTNKHSVGTPLYMAPETCANGISSRHSDIFSAGLMIGGFLLGECPDFPKIKNMNMLQDHRVNGEEKFELHQFVPVDMQGSVMFLLQAMTSKKPDDRPTAREVVDKLEFLRLWHNARHISQDSVGLDRLEKTYQVAQELREFSENLVLNKVDSKKQKIADLKEKMLEALQSLGDDFAEFDLFMRVFHAATLKSCHSKNMVANIFRVFNGYDKALQQCNEKLPQIREWYFKMRNDALRSTQDTELHLQHIYSDLETLIYNIQKAPVSLDHLSEQTKHMQRKLKKIENIISEHFKLEPAVPVARPF